MSSDQPTRHYPSYRPGYDVHFIQAKLAGRTPWGWRAGVVRSNRDGSLVIDYVLEPGEIEVWNVRRIDAPAGTPVRIHERYRLLDVGGGWFNVAIVSGGLGPVPDPELPELWTAEQQISIVDVAAGRAIAVDTEDSR